MSTMRPRTLGREEAILGWSAAVLLGAVITLLTVAALKLQPPPAPAAIGAIPPGVVVTSGGSGSVSISMSRPSAEHGRAADDDE